MTPRLTSVPLMPKAWPGCPGSIWQGLRPPGHRDGGAGLTLSGQMEGESYLHHQRASKYQWSSCPARSGRWCLPAAHWPRWWGPLLGQEGAGVSKGHHQPQIKGITSSWSQPCSPSVLETSTLPAKSSLVLWMLWVVTSQDQPTCAWSCFGASAILGVLCCLKRGIN